jgi:hypothetical protein
MKTKTANQEKAKPAKALLIISLIFIQTALIASDGSELKHHYTRGGETQKRVTENSVASIPGNTFYYIPEVAPETEYELEDWMCDVHNEFWDSAADEAEVELEDWMCDTSNSFWSDIIRPREEELAIEEWMKNPDSWIQESKCLSMNTK